VDEYLPARPARSKPLPEYKRNFLERRHENRGIKSQHKKKAPVGAFLVLTALLFYLAAISSSFFALASFFVLASFFSVDICSAIGCFARHGQWPLISVAGSKPQACSSFHNF
jgi:hypothetical protein